MMSASMPDVVCIGQPRLTAGLDRFQRIDLATHREVFGTMPRLDIGRLISIAERVDLRGRGGAAFPVARKLRAVVKSSHDRKRRPVVLVNATEGEPGSAKDSMLMLRSPFLVLAGALLAARALRATEIIVGVTRNDIANSISAAAEEEPSLNWLVRVVKVPDRFVSGEGGALVNAVNGKGALPPGRKRLAADTGVDDRPTLLSNAETFAQLAILAMLGPEGYASTGTADEPGTVLLTVGGSADRPAVLEVPSGLPLGEVLDLCSAAHADGVLVGGYHGMWLSTDAAYRVPVSRAGLAAAGGVLGAGIVLPLDEGTCPMGEIARVAIYLAQESSGQCGPCKLGLPGIARSLAAVADGSGGIDALDTARRGAAAVKGRGACAHPDGAFRFVMSALDVFTDDLTAHMFRGTCGRPTLGILPLPEQQDQTRLAVDWTRCHGHGLCARLVPELIQLDSQGYPVFLDMPVPPWLQTQAQKAIQMCPSLALKTVVKAPAPAHGKRAKTAVQPAPAKRALPRPAPAEPEPLRRAIVRPAGHKPASLRMVASKSSEFELETSEEWIAELSDVGRQIPRPIN
jgi:NADH:ubiquinone oxidoreductase subunit F (NADH-binding)/ferredoxin